MAPRMRYKRRKATHRLPHRQRCRKDGSITPRNLLGKGGGASPSLEDNRQCDASERQTVGRRHQREAI
eukprot:6133158-Prymnesium_polylepis.2